MDGASIRLYPPIFHMYKGRVKIRARLQITYMIMIILEFFIDKKNVILVILFDVPFFAQNGVVRVPKINNKNATFQESLVI